jgi:hypothetical protein
MINIKLDNNKILVVGSAYDSGVHKGFAACVGDTEDWSSTLPLDEVLTKEQIKSVEYIIAATIKGYLQEIK